MDQRRTTYPPNADSRIHVRFVCLSALRLLALFIPLSTALAQTAQVSYQGELKKDGWPYTGVAQMKFAILDWANQSLWSNDGASVGGSEPAT
jgi:hypothetical protein